MLTDDDVPFARFVDLSREYQLGPGETECLVLGEALGCSVCCDDLRARKMISKEIGSDRLTGTLGLIQTAVMEGLITEEQAHSAHSKMIASGAFLPPLSLTAQTTDVAGR